jgi:hypothetical protein
MGIVSEILPTFSGKALFGYPIIVFSGAVIGFLGFAVWSHHMFTTGLGPVPTAAFALLTMAIAVPTGVSAVFNVRGATLNIASGQIWLAPRPFPYFQLYYLNNPVPQPGVPAVYSQFGQGENGTLYFSPLPDFNYVANVDAVCVPQALVDDTTVEAIPAPYTDAVPYYAAYLAFLSAQRAADADRMFQEYSKFASRARQMSNGSVNPGQYPQQPDPTRANLLGAQPQQGG